MTHSLLVYGTLRRGGPTVDVPGYLHNIGWFPGIVLHDNPEGPFVKCEELIVTDDELERMDSYEGHNENNPEDSFFRRVKLDNGSFIYTPNFEFTKELIESGDWFEHNPESFRKVV